MDEKLVLISHLSETCSLLHMLALVKGLLGSCLIKLQFGFLCQIAISLIGFTIILFVLAREAKFVWVHSFSIQNCEKEL